MESTNEVKGKGIWDGTFITEAFCDIPEEQEEEKEEAERLHYCTTCEAAFACANSCCECLRVHRFYYFCSTECYDRFESDE
jgi:hypothetical protein